MDLVRKGNTFIKWSLLATLILIQLGCAASQKMTNEDRSEINSVYIDEYIALPEYPIILTRGDVLSGVFAGIVGAAIAAGNTTKEQATLEYLQQHNIKVDALLVDAFKKEFASRNIFKLVEFENEADAIIKLEILIYGISQNGNGFSTKYRTMLNSKATMTKSDKVVWIKQVIDSATNKERPQVDLDQFYENPETLRTHMDIITTRAASLMVQDLFSEK